jgi:peptidoglycan hydrolase-like protein with peptidoglycan-binding domain
MSKNLNNSSQDRVVLTEGDRGETICLVQKALNYQKYCSSNGKKLELDGYFGPHTVESVKSFQKDHGRAQTGELDFHEMEILLKPFNLSIAPRRKHFFSERSLLFLGSGMLVIYWMRAGNYTADFSVGDIWDIVVSLLFGGK